MFFVCISENISLCFMFKFANGEAQDVTSFFYLTTLLVLFFPMNIIIIMKPLNIP